MFKPLLASRDCPSSNSKYFQLLRYPLLASPKLDGIRALVMDGKVVSRTLKEIPSKQVQKLFSDFEGFDGELIEGCSTDSNVYNRTQSHVMSEDNPGNIVFHVFDLYDKPELPFHKRFDELCDIFYSIPSVEIVPHKHIPNETSLLEYEAECLQRGYEGIMLRNPTGLYKYGRSTIRENILIKLKRFEDAEGVVVDVHPKFRNDSPQERDELGYAKRSENKDLLTEIPQVGTFTVMYEDKCISVAPGNFSHAELENIWYNRNRFIGSVLKFRYFGYGIKDLPRFPRAIGWRDPIDI